MLRILALASDPSNAKWEDPREERPGTALVSIRSRSHYEVEKRPLAQEGVWMKALIGLRS